MSSLSALSPIAKIGRYDIIGRLASGGMAEIFLARESGPRTVERHVVVKRILPHHAEDPRIVEMFVHEAKLCMHLSHPNICPIYEFGETAGTFFLAMEWVRGVSLRDLLVGRLDLLPIPFVVKIFSDIASALHHAHTCTDAEGHPLSIVHRDVNPENIMIGFDGVAKLLDFGVAKAATQKHKTEAGNLKGKFAYISPEQYQGMPLDGRSDVFSLGVSLYEALTGRSLYERASEYETVAAIVLDPDVPSVRESRPEVPAELEAIVTHALAKERDARTQSADELAEALTRFGTKHGALRHSDVARTLRELVPDRFNKEPELDRTAPTLTKIKLEQPAPPPRDRIHDILLTVEADKEAEELYGRKSGRWVGVLAVLVILASLGVIGWLVWQRLPQNQPTSSETR